MQLYKNIEQICKDKNIPVAKLEREAGIPNGTLRRWGTISPGIKSVIAVADYLDVSIDELCGRESTDAMIQTEINYVQEHNKLTRVPGTINAKKLPKLGGFSLWYCNRSCNARKTPRPKSGQTGMGTG